jgi:hypothetical protein
MASTFVRNSQGLGSQGLFASTVVQHADTVSVPGLRFNASTDMKVYRLFSFTVRVQDGTPWPRHTDIKCWHCCHSFASVPISIPHVHVHRYYEVYGVFCSLNCAKRFILDTKTYDVYTILMSLNEVCIKIFGLADHDVFACMPAPPRCFLDLFGGHLNIEAFRTLSLQCYSEVVTPPFVSRALILSTFEPSCDSSLLPTPQSNGKNDGKTSLRASSNALERLINEEEHLLRGIRRPEVPITKQGDETVHEGCFVSYVEKRRLEEHEENEHGGSTAGGRKMKQVKRTTTTTAKPGNTMLGFLIK